MATANHTTSSDLRYRRKLTSIFRDKNFQIPAYPRGFMRPTNTHSLIGHRSRVTIPASYETMRASAELGVVIGKTGRNIPEESAMGYVYGYTLVNDMCSDSWKVVALQGRMSAGCMRISQFSHNVQQLPIILGPGLVCRNRSIHSHKR